MNNEEKLSVIDGETLADLDLPPTKFYVQTLLPQGISILGGAPKVGKSWLVLDLCVRVAKGEPIWNLPTTKGTTLYLCLEDTLRRVQERLLCITDDVPANAFFTIAAKSLAEGLCEQIRNFCSEHKDTVLVAIDTFQMIRGDSDVSYANDYGEVRQLKQLADELEISILLVHHLRKQKDDDPLNKLSGTTGLSGAVDAVFVLSKGKRSSTDAKLVCTGRDISYRELWLEFLEKECRWEVQKDSLEEPILLLPEEMVALYHMMEDVVSFHGSNSEFAELFTQHTGITVTPKSLKQKMNRWRQELRNQGVTFENKRSNGTRSLHISFSAVGSDASDASDAKDGGGKFCDPCVTCDPV